MIMRVMTLVVMGVVMGVAMRVAMAMPAAVVVVVMIVMKAHARGISPPRPIAPPSVQPGQPSLPEDHL